VAAVPLVYRDSNYGVLVVYADEPAAFDAAERDLLTDVASDIAYATNVLDLRREVDRLTEFVEHAPMGVFNTDPASDGVMLEANPAMAEIFDADSVDDVVGRPVVDFYADTEDRAAVLETLVSEGVVTRELPLRTLSGREIWGHVTLVRNEQPDGSFVIAGAIKDVTARKELEQRLSEELTFIESILETSPVAIAVLDPNGTIVRANEYAEDVLGLAEPDIVDRAYDAPKWQIFDENDEPIPSADLPFARVMRTGAPVYDYEHGIEHPDGQRIWLSINIVPITNANGDVVQAVAAMSDISELKAQEEALDERQRQIAFFNNLLRHEVLNGMTVIEGTADLLGEDLAADDDRSPLVERIRSRSDDIVTTVQRVRKVLRQLTVEEPDLAAHDLAAVVADRVAQLESDYPNAAVSVDASDEAPVLTDDLLRDVVYNLLANAVQHNDRADPTVDVTVTVDGGTTTLRVADDGPGIPDDIKEEVFGRGDWTPTSPSGFGLYFVDTMVSRYGGSVWAEDNDPRGTVFVAELPTANEP
jgi:PAS domain S-box-containing protein